MRVPIDVPEGGDRGRVQVGGGVVCLWEKREKGKGLGKGVGGGTGKGISKSLHTRLSECAKEAAKVSCAETVVQRVFLESPFLLCPLKVCP